MVRWLLLAVFMILWGGAPARAQEAASFALTDLAARLPALGDEALPVVTFVDLAAVREAYPNVALTDPDGPLFTYARGSSAVADLFMADREGMRAAIGLGFEDIDRVLTYGQMPTQLTILQGEFDAAAVSAAFAALGFATDSPDDAYTRFCNPDGCDQASQVSLRDRNVANPFGGSLGRREAIALFDHEAAGADVLMASADAAVLEAAAARFAAATAPDPDPALMMTAASLQAAAGDEGRLAGAVILPGTLMVGENMDASTRLPPYERLAVAAYVGGPLPRTEVVMVYSEGARVDPPPPVLAARLAQESIRVRSSYRDLFAERGVTVSDLRYQALAEGWGALLLTLSSEGPSDVGYRLMNQMLDGRDAGWLTP